MNVNVGERENNTVKLEITVPAADFKKAINKAYRKNVQKFNIPGFRKGKAPQMVIEKMYGEEVFYDDAVNFAIEDTYPKAIEENNIQVVDRPEIDIVDIGRGKDLVYTATVTVKPEVELGQYTGLEVAKVEYPVTDEDVEKQLQSMREKNARILTKEEGTVEKGDTVVIDFKGYKDGVPFEGGSAEDYSLEIGSGSFIEGFEEQLIGKSAGEEVDVNVTFPEDYRPEELAGKPVVFKVKIKEIKYKELLPLDDEFAKDVSEFDTLEELKADIRKKQEEINNLRAKREFEDAVVKKAVENAKVDIPDVMVDREVDYMIQDISYRLQYQGITVEQYAELIGTTVDKMKEDYREIAYNKVKTSLVIEKIGEVENIQPTDEDIDKEIERIAKQYNQEIDKLKESIKENQTEIIKEEIVYRKTVEFLVEKAVPVE